MAGSFQGPDPRFRGLTPVDHQSGIRNEQLSGQDIETWEGEGAAASGPSDPPATSTIVRRACEEPVRQIVLNCGTEGFVVVEKIKTHENANFG